MDAKLKVPPANKNELTKPEILAEKLSCLIGHTFKLTGKSRTDGSNVRKLVASTLLVNTPPAGASKNDFEVIPPKGVPKILLEYVDTYIVTSGTSYNLQVWNRNPYSESVQVQYHNGKTLQSGEVRFVLVKVDPEEHVICSISVLTPEYIVEKFGQFGKPTVKNQLIISSSARKSVLAEENGILFYHDDKAIGDKNNIKHLANKSIHDEPSNHSLIPLSIIKDIIIEKVVGQSIAPAATKNRGQMLEEIIANALGYTVKEGELLAGGYPDIRNQALEVKIQDSPTVDLGKYSPEFEDSIASCNGFTTRSMRYMIALTNPETNIVEGAILCPGNKLGLHFTYVSEESYKCQRSIPMSFFEENLGQSVFNP
ncbi:MAG: nuclease [bacterium]